MAIYTEKGGLLLPQPDNAPVLLPIRQFAVDLPNRFAQTNVHAWFQAMYYRPGGEMDVITDALSDAAKRGVDSRFAFDDISNLSPASETVMFRRLWRLNSQKYRQAASERQSSVTDMRESGVDVKLLRPAGLDQNAESLLKLAIPVWKTNHMKAIRADNAVAIFGANGTHNDLNRLDSGVWMTRPDIVEKVSFVMNSIWNKQIPSDDAFPLPPDYDLFVDWGKFNTSRIYEETIKFIGETKDQLSIGSQYVIDHNVLQEIKTRARRGAEIHLHTSPIEHNKFNSAPHVIEYLRSLRTIIEEPNIYLFHHPTTEMHLKAMTRDKEAAMFGSHNFVWMGTKLATAEIAMLSRDPVLAAQFVDFFNEIERHTHVEKPHRYHGLFNLLSHPIIRKMRI